LELNASSPPQEDLMARNNQQNFKNNAEWIRLCEQEFSKQFSRIAEDICKNRGLRIVRLYGPTCSGKTTAARLLIDMFARLGHRAHLVSIDDFFYDREVLLKQSAAKGLKGLDYDSPDTIDCEELGRFVEEIFESSEVHCPVFDFKVGARTGYKTMSIAPDDIIIFEGIQACYPVVKQMFSLHGSASIFIAPLKSVRAADVEFAPNRLRLMRRLVRDFHFRNSTPEFTFGLWKSVRDNERKNIFPYAEQSDYSVNSAMPYEVGVLKPYLCEILAQIDSESEYFEKSRQILDSIQNVEPIDSSLIIDDYLYSEFV
jgi:uridine kinase